MKIKQVFCNHIYKFVEESFLREAREGTGIRSIRYYYSYGYYLEKYECVKCGKIKFIEKRKLMV